MSFLGTAGAQEIPLQDLVQEALKDNPEIRASQARIEAARYRIPQARSLPDPMLMTGYQNDGFSKITYGSSNFSQLMFSASQQFPLWGKRELKGEMAEKDAAGLIETHRSLQLKTISRVSELYYDLFLGYKNIDLIRSRAGLFTQIENIAASRYAAGKSTQQEVLMAQTEKYMLLEREEMIRQKILANEAMLASTLGRTSGAPIERPAEPEYVPFTTGLDELTKMMLEHSPELKSREWMVGSAESKLKMTKKEYYPDVTVNGTFFQLGGEFSNMWSLTTTFNIPLYFRSRQEPAVKEASAGLVQARREVDATRLMIQAVIRDNYSMIRSTEKLMDLYKKGLIPKTYQDFELSLSGYGTGRVEAIVAITRLKNLIDFENLYWTQFAEREKAIARLHAVAAPPPAGSF